MQNATERVIVVESLEQGTEYSFSITAENRNGLGFPNTTSVFTGKLIVYEVLFIRH